jgi:tagatose-1,6-bisphosphate aldolase
MTLASVRHPDGVIRVLAIDHRDSMRAFLAPDAPDSVAPSRLTAIKADLARAVLPHASGVMLEPEYSIPQLRDAGAVPAGVGVIAALEAQGYLADPGAAPTAMLAGWSPAAALASGAAAAKLLVPYHPDHPLAAAQEQVAADVLAECRQAGIPLVLEPLFFGLASPAERQPVVLRTVEHFAALGPDLLKLPFPVDPAAETDRRAWADACRRVTERAPMGWALLSGGGSFDAFAAQLAAAFDQGCGGFMVGRALWGEAARANDADRQRIIDELVLPRWERLAALTDRRIHR